VGVPIYDILTQTNGLKNHEKNKTDSFAGGYSPKMDAAPLRRACLG
jgi:hypothetical protein